MKKKASIAIICVMILLTIIVSTTFAYFTATVEGNETATNYIVSTGKLHLNFTDGVEIMEDQILPGFSISKNFTVYNDGTAPVSYDINLIDITNEISRKSDLVYSITGSNEKIATRVPSKDSSLMTITEILPGETHSYIFNLTYKNLEVDQSVDMNKLFKGKLNISEVGFYGSTEIVSVESSGGTSFALTTSGNIYGWGANSNNAISEENKNTMTPQKIENISGITQLNSKSSFFIALNNSGDVYSWGSGSYGKLGQGTTTAIKTPTMIEALKDLDIIDIKVGNEYTLALTSDGDVYSWGRNNTGQLGDGTTTDVLTPTKISSLSNIVMIATGAISSLALNDAGEVFAWGDNAYNILADGTTTDAYTPTKISTLSNIAKVYAFNYTYFVVDTSGNVYGWGNNSSGELGDGTTTKKTTPTINNILSLLDIKEIVGYNFSMFLTTDGFVYATGNNEFGQLGDGTGISKTIPIKLELERIVDISAQSQNTMILNEDGEVFIWGANGSRQIGDETNTISNLPQKIPDLNSITKIAAATVNTGASYAINNNNELLGWGLNANNTMGAGNNVATLLTPTKINLVSNVSEVASGAGVISIVTNKLGYSWGANGWGQLGVGITNNLLSTPYKINLTNVTKTDVASFSIAIIANGYVYMAGSNSSGQLGLSENPYGTQSSNSPVQITGFSGATDVSVNQSYVLACTSSGYVYSWGKGNQLGWEGNQYAFRTPGRITSLSNIIQVEAAVAAGYALNRSGKVYTWGTSSYGGLGIEGLTSQLTPIQIPSLTDIKEISAQEYFALAVNNSGEVYAWGANESGQLGLGDTVVRNTPTKITALEGIKIVAISAGNKFSLALSEDGEVYAWGLNDRRQLGYQHGNHYSPFKVEF